jgi:hypothetical protein
MRLFALGAAGAIVVAAAIAVPAAGKSGVRATLTSRVPLAAAAGTKVRVSWKLAYRDAHRSFSANGIFIRLVGACEGQAKRTFAQGTNGRYAATATVPEGGIRKIEIGLRGWSSSPKGTVPSDMLFPITNNPLGR